MHRSVRNGVSIALGVAMLGAAGAYWLTSREAIAAVAPAPASIPVQAAVAVQADVPVFLDGLGTVQAFNTVTVKAKVDGELQQVLFTEGQSVKKGDLLAVIDPRPFQAAFDQASAKMVQDQANLDNDKIILQRDKKLTAQEFTTVETTQTQQSTVAQLQAQIAQDAAAKDAAAVSLSYTQMIAPVDGRTGLRLVDQGNYVHATDTTGIVVITQTQPISVVSTLPEDDLAAVRAAQDAGTVSVTAYSRDGSAKLGTGTLSVIDNEIDQTSGTMRLKSTFPNMGEKLWPGQFVDIRLQEKVVHQAITVPSAALERGQDGFFVYVVNPDDTVEVRSIKPGQISSGRALIESGLTPGERVVTAGQYRLEAGSRVSVEAMPDKTTDVSDADREGD
ncbi:efflux RND transporter periplasmic adaptor subunit [Phyllobacterium endophyticum]|uniref:Efflux RND transporter periplasmic adaptor subunit n=1 Tax=Phyllobacterium endophyticum TaxID=1149773 RepID=A0A2P7B0P8_9HYPH|nr:efflux RND transporter periplasmic adaptor subunit [Phyllobacterium endophyticum]MBB3237560.1 multidrug efflux system membrane fusion protein [Phyllobacterium endophyticum]PSH60038.1 efflux RND transporter periplasmic adaptor subunit [Phyllobacterium endophyticum]TXR48407.1 efflux RND transporter periplasmic adaptor subunit [Phyllobacterium endophyticum]TYR42205.1 efflux RND transporter periplasmic adaptor subunit [Phyllobacterium endophyticum]